MRCNPVLLSSILAMMPLAAIAQQTDNSSMVGVWRGNEGALPAITLHITNDGGTLAGAVVFYLIRREPGKEPNASPGIPEPLLHLKMDRDTLTFEVSHRLAHPPRTLSDPPVQFHLKLDGPDRAKIYREGDGQRPEGDGQQIEMVRDNYR